MKIVYFHQHFSTPEGSSGIRSYQMAQKAVAMGHQVTMVCGSYSGGRTGLEGPFTNGRRRGLVNGIDVVEFELEYSNRDGFLKRTATFLKYAIASIRFALSEPYDLLFATTTPLTSALPGIAARWLRGKPFVFEVRDLWPELPRAMGVIRNPVILGAMGVLEWSAYHSAHRIVGLSPGIVDGIAKRGIDRERIAHIPNGCDLDIFAADAKPWRPEGVAPSDLMAVFAGTHGIANGLDSVLDTAAELKRRQVSNVKIVLIGQGKLKSHLQARAASEGIDNVIFVDPVNKARLAGLMGSTDIGLQVLANVPAFYFGTSPNKFFDYIAAGLPVLNNYPGWLARLIEENGCGVAVPPDDPAAFANALQQLVGKRDELAEMGARARALAQARFDRNKLAEDWVGFVTGCTTAK